jgi:tellurite resistance protein TehA-like permease
VIARALERLLAVSPPASGAIVMGTGIVSIGLSLDGREIFSRVLLVLAAMSWTALAMVLSWRVLHDRERARREARSPAALTGVAGTAVLGARFLMLGWGGVGSALLAIAAILWLVLLRPVLAGWATPTIGVSLMMTVSTESLAVLAAMLAAHARATWLLYAALAPFLLGIAFYVVVISRFDLAELLAGRGDHWITGGALAISTLAAGWIALDTHTLHRLAGLGGPLRTASAVLWALTIAWLPALVAAEALRPRLGYDLRRWSTVFPFGMYAACSFAAGAAARSTGIIDFGRVWIWAAVVVWLLVLAGLVRRGLDLARGQRPPSAAAQQLG